MCRHMRDLTSEDAYMKMLDEAYKKIPAHGLRDRTTRFKPPEVRIFHQGKSKTVFLNFKDTCDYLNRDPNIVRKFLARELATPAIPSDKRLILHTRIDNMTLQNTINFFIKRYVRCPICEGYDTQLVKKDRALMIKCMICGAESPVPPIK